MVVPDTLMVALTMPIPVDSSVISPAIIPFFLVSCMDVPVLLITPAATWRELSLPVS